MLYGPGENSSTLPPRGCWVCDPSGLACTIVYGFWATRRGGMIASNSNSVVAVLELEAIAVAVGALPETGGVVGIWGSEAGLGATHREKPTPPKSKAPAAARAR
ncbi:hypothetical protein D3C86_1926150 [compost metagenome]